MFSACAERQTWAWLPKWIHKSNESLLSSGHYTPARWRVRCSALLKWAANVVPSAFRRQVNPLDMPPLILVQRYRILCNKQENGKKAFGCLDNGHLPYVKLKNMFLWAISTVSFSWQSWPLLCFEIFPFSTLLIYPLSQWKCVLADWQLLQFARTVWRSAGERSDPSQCLKVLCLQGANAKQSKSSLFSAMSVNCKYTQSSLFPIAPLRIPNFYIVHVWVRWDWIKGNGLVILTGLYCSTQQWPARCRLKRIFYSLCSDCWGTLAGTQLNCLNAKAQGLLLKKISKAYNELLAYLSSWHGKHFPSLLLKLFHLV